MRIHALRTLVPTALLGVGLVVGGAAFAQTSSAQSTPNQQNAPQAETATPYGGMGQPYSQSPMAGQQPMSEQQEHMSGQQQMSGQMASSQPAGNSAPITLVDPGKIYNENPTSWVGKTVTLKNVTVQDTNDTGNFWVGSDSSHRLLIVKPENNPNIAAMRFHKGDIVTITGVVHPASQYMAQQTTASNDSMGDARDSSGVFLLANNISITSSTQH